MKKKRISGRRVEYEVYKSLKQVYPNAFIFRYNENRRNATPADIQLITKDYNVLLEVKASSSNYIYTHSVRPNQIKSLTLFSKLQDNNLGIIVLWYDKSKSYVLLPIYDLSQINESRMMYDKMINVGKEIKDWKDIKKILRSIYAGKQK